MTRKIGYPSGVLPSTAHIPHSKPGFRLEAGDQQPSKSYDSNMNSQLISLNQPVIFLVLIAAFITASFDIFLMVKIGDSQVRLSQLLEIAFILLALIFNSHIRKISWPVGFGYALCWASFCILWTPNTYDIWFSTLYTAWLIVSLTKIFAMCQVFREKKDIITLYRAYINIFVIVSIFGLMQFILGRFSISLLVTQWWFSGFPRVNGFSYEPSYFATYLISGWGICVYLVEKSNGIFSKRRNSINFLIVTFALTLSTSRMGVIVVGIYCGYYLMRMLYKLIFLNRISGFDLKLLIISVFTALPLVAYMLNRVDFKSYLFLLSGTGLAGTASHSSTIRLGQFGETIDLFMRSPIIGYGMGGIGSYLGRAHGEAPNVATGMNVTAEVLASSGLLGFPFFVLFMWMVIVKPVTSRFAPGELRDALQSASVGMALLFLILQFNQSILRLYVWNHIAIVCVLYAGCMRFSRLGSRAAAATTPMRLAQHRLANNYGVRSASTVKFNRGPAT